MNNCLTIQIGNSDDKLSQRMWHRFTLDLREILDDLERDGRAETHFYGCSACDAQWQDACLVAVVHDQAAVDYIRERLALLAGDYNQLAIALTAGQTEFIEPSGRTPAGS